MTRIVVLGSLLLFGWGCGLVGPSCIDRQERGSGAMINGEVAPGQVVLHLVPYETEGSQNDVHFSWAGQSTAGGPQVRVYATRAGCDDFRPPPAANITECAVLGSAGATSGGLVATILIVTHGRGNPEVLGSPPQYKLWVVGDPSQSARYTINITWFSGPDC